MRYPIMRNADCETKLRMNTIRKETVINYLVSPLF